jgi:3-deoxy-manno-octulosonate cytidylyltransferase (CMP-KDO synthetase)
MLGLPMIVRVWQQAVAADIGPVLVACAEPEIAQVIDQAGGIPILTHPDLPSGSDRVRQAAALFDPDEDYKIILNLQGDMPLIDPQALRETVRVLIANPQADIATAVTPIDDPEEIANPNIVKAVLDKTGRALYFSRSPVPYGAHAAYHHVGLYAYRREALTRFCSLPPSVLEQTERLEQLRALEDGMQIYAVELETAPMGVDVPADLVAANAVLAG